MHISIQCGLFSYRKQSAQDTDGISMETQSFQQNVFAKTNIAKQLLWLILKVYASTCTWLEQHIHVYTSDSDRV